MNALHGMSGTPCSRTSMHRQNRTRTAAMSSTTSFRPASAPLIKICGVTNAEDATAAAQAGANLIGMIMWPKAKRAVTDSMAKQIADIARQHNALAVGVFVDETPETIKQRCQSAGIPVAQLHGDGARAGLQALQGSGLQLVYVMHATPDGRLVTPLPPQDMCDWLLVDGLQGGSGQALEWANLQPPWGVARNGWLLAGGLKPENVHTAVCLARPTGVDVSSGVCGPDGLKKDVRKIEAFVAGVRAASPQPSR